MIYKAPKSQKESGRIGWWTKGWWVKGQHQGQKVDIIAVHLGARVICVSL